MHDPGPFACGVKSIHCVEETDEIGDDEPYLIMLTVDLANRVAGVPPPRPGLLPVGRSKVIFQCRKAARDLCRSGPFWGLIGEERALSNPGDVIVICRADGER